MGRENDMMGEAANQEDLPEDNGDDLPESFVDELKPGTKLLQGQYTVLEFLNSGGFGITYLAKDSLDRTVVIKECFPGSFCRRSETIVRARSRAHHGDFRSVVRLFVQEARSLSKLIHPNIVGVHQVFEDNDTAYMAIDYIDGRDMLDIIEDESITFTPEQVVGYLRKMLEAVAFIHKSNVLHRDISPDNILLNSEGEPILIDFGAAREQASKASRALSALRVVKDGYSPQEFYITGSTQSPSSDLYALAASFYHMITGETPPDSQRRLAGIADQTGDPYVPLSGRFEGYPVGFLESIDKAISVLPKDRIASAEDWLRMMDEGERVQEATTATTRSAEIETAVSQLVQTTADGSPEAPKATDAKTAAAIAVPNAANDPASQPAAAAASQGGGNGKAILLGTVGVIALAIGVGVLTLSDGDETAPADTSTGVVVSGATETNGGADATAAEEAAAAEAAAAEQAAAEAAAAEAAAAEQAAAEAAAAEAAAAEQAAAEAAAAEAAAAEQAAAAEAAAAEQAAAEAAAAEAAAAEQAAAEAAAAEAAAAEQAAAEAAAAEAAAAEQAAAEAAAAATTQQAQDSILRDQIDEARWDIVVPFQTRVAEIDGEPFPVVSQVSSAVSNVAASSWLREGVTIYAINDEWVSDQASIENLIEQISTVDDDGFFAVNVRIRTEAEGPFEHVTLAIPTTRWVTLKNGVVFRTEPVNGNWRTSVESAPPGIDDGLATGDILVSERVTGLSIESAQSVETIIDLLAQQDEGNAIFAVNRDDTLTIAEMPMVRE